MKNIGIGVDIENIDRFRNLNQEKDNNFFDKIYTEKELDYCFSKEYPAQHLAVRFAGKEAVIKALSSVDNSIRQTKSMTRTNTQFKNIEILNKKNGIPSVELHEPFLKQLKVKISLSHCQDKAVAFAVIEEND